jgi:hypothetical protein
MTTTAFAVILVMVGGVLFWWGYHHWKGLPTWDNLRFLPIAPGALLLLIGTLLLTFLWHPFWGIICLIVVFLTWKTSHPSRG